jgi:moderate conductance mechanosensitive channel
MPNRSRNLRGIVLVLAAMLALLAPARSQAPSPAAPAPSAEDLQRLVDTLQDPAARQHLVADLQALIAAQKDEQPEAAAAPASIFDDLSAQVDTVTGEILATAQVVVDAPRLAGWLRRQIGEPRERDFWLGVGTRLALIFGAGLIADWLTQFALRGVARRVASQPGTTVPARLFLVLLGIVIAALPVVVFAAIASVVVPFTAPAYGTRQVARVLIGAILWARGTLAVARVALLAPSAVALYPLGEETRNYLYIWARRFINWSVYGFAVASGAWWLGVPGAIYALVLRATVLVLAILAIIFVLQNRKPVADWLRGNGQGAAGWRVIRYRLGDTWHVLAIIYIIGTFGVFVLEVQGGYLFLLRATVITVVVMLASALLVRFIERLSRRGFAIGPETKARYPSLEARANRYLPVFHYVTAAIIYAFAALALLQAWGIDAFAWFGTDSGRRATGSIVVIAVVVAAALISWELFSAAIERYLHASDRDGTPLARSARALTLLPLLRTSVLVLILGMAGLIVLSQLGLDIAPLLAGAGVVGIAVGFGSQALVKDVITGLFILIEGTLAVGEMVDLGAGLGPGVVEAITIRTIRLRDVSGTLVTIPFSSVTTVRNMARDYAYAVLDVGVLYREDVDKVVAVLTAVAAEMQADRAWAARVRAPLEVVGLDHFSDTAQVVRIRLMTAPMQQWPVQREFNRRMKKAFDAHGIEMPSANQTRYLEPPAPASA